MDLYTQLMQDLDEFEQATLRATPGPWHRINTVVMKRVPDPTRGIPRLPMRTEARETPDENFWDDVQMTEVHVLDTLQRGTGYLAHAEREEDAAHMARCDREFVLWLIQDYRQRLTEHRKCAEVCTTLRSVQQFLAQSRME